MGWLDAHEVYVMEAVVRDRVDELCASAYLAWASGEAPGGGPESEPVRPTGDSREICRGSRHSRRLGAPGLAC